MVGVEFFGDGPDVFGAVGKGDERYAWAEGFESVYSADDVVSTQSVPTLRHSNAALRASNHRTQW